MTLPDRTLCWVEGPPWDRACDPVGVLLPSEETALDLTLLRRRLERLSNHELGQVLALVLSRVDELGATSLPDLLRDLASAATALSVVDAAPHHRGQRVRLRGRCVDENSDERGEYVEVELEEGS